MPALDATAGGVNANSYLTVADADDYNNFRRVNNSTWVDAESQDKVKALQMATRLLDTRVEWTGAPATATQALVWPRTGMTDRNGNAIAINVIPRDLKDATAELAQQLLVTDSATEDANQIAGLTGLKAGPVQLTWAQKKEQERTERTHSNMIPEYVESLLVPSWFTGVDRASSTEETLLVFDIL